MVSVSLVVVNKLYRFYITAVVGIIGGHGLTIDACHKNQPKKSYIASVVYAVNLL